MTENFYESEGFLDDDLQGVDIAPDPPLADPPAPDPPAPKVSRLDPVDLAEAYKQLFFDLGFEPGNVTISRSEVTKKLRFNSDNPTQPSPAHIGVYLAENRPGIQALIQDTNNYVAIMSDSLPNSNHLKAIKGHQQYLNNLLKTALPNDLKSVSEYDKDGLDLHIKTTQEALKNLSHPNDATRLRLQKGLKRLLRQAEKRQKSL